MRILNRKKFYRQLTFTAGYIGFMCEELEEFECFKLSKEGRDLEKKLRQFIEKMK